MKYRFLITGAGFSNTGAQAMMFTTVSELKKRFPNSVIKVINTSSVPNKYLNNLTFEYVECGISEFYSIQRPHEKVVTLAKQFVKKVLGKKTCPLNSFKKTVAWSDYIIDISGFALGDQWSDQNCLSFLARIKMAKKYNKSIIIMPQTIGNFDFKTKNRERILSLINELLPYPKRIFCRETQGYELLQSLGLKNLSLSSDIVLQSSIETFDNILVNANKEANETSKIDGFVAIIPNIHCYDYNHEKLISIYKNTIEYLLNHNEKVVIVRHSEADKQVCQLVKNEFLNNDNVALIDKRTDFFGYNEMVSHFKFAIASRFHSIVHAYNHCIPCVALGWSLKYTELLKSVGQIQYAVDFRYAEDFGEIVSKIDNLRLNLDNEKAIIDKNLKKIKENNCFIEVERIING